MQNPLTTLLSPVYSARDVIDKIKNNFNSSEENAKKIVDAIRDSKESISLKDVMKFEQGFGHLKSENHIFGDYESGYKPSELAFILDQLWWKGNMDGTTFKGQFEDKPKGSILVRFSQEECSFKKAFVIGIKLEQVDLWKFIQSADGFINVSGRPYRLLQDVVSDFAISQGYPLEEKREEIYTYERCIRKCSISECIVCMDAPRQILLTPCNHVDVCESCSEKIERCPSCRTPIETRSRVFLS